MHTKILLENLEGRQHVGDVSFDGGLFDLVS